jgi:spore maturation protein SpmA
MHELQRLNTTPDTATNSMAMFLAINTSNVTLVPIAVIGYRAKYGSEAPAEPLFGTLVVTLLATIAAVVACRVLEQLPRYRTTIDDNSLAKES